MKKIITLMILSLSLCFTFTARAGDNDATVMLKGVADHLIAKLNSDKAQIDTDPNHIVSLVDTIIMPVTDFELIAKHVLGTHWRTATDVQRERFLKEFKLLLIVTYMAAFRSYKDQTVDFTGQRSDPSDPTRVEVRTLIKEPGAAPIPVNYRLIQENGAWKVYDFNVDGVGLTSSFRSQFNNAIQQKGLDAVLVDMAERNAKVFKK
jgi:phospholipid transport system substrate-binding protein